MEINIFQMYICDVFGVYTSTNITNHIAQTLSNHHLEPQVRATEHIQLGCAYTGADRPIVCVACGEPESVGEACAFSVIL